MRNHYYSKANTTRSQLQKNTKKKKYQTFPKKCLLTNHQVEDHQAAPPKRSFKRTVQHTLRPQETTSHSTTETSLDLPYLSKRPHPKHKAQKGKARGTNSLYPKFTKKKQKYPIESHPLKKHPPNSTAKAPKNTTKNH